MRLAGSAADTVTASRWQTVILLQVEHDLVDRELELAHDRKEGVDRWFGLTRLDLRDQARGYTQPPREFSQPYLLFLSGLPKPVT